MARSLGVSVGTTALSAVVLVALAGGLGLAAGVSSIVANLCGIGPSYWFNRRVAWRRRGRGDLRREVIPFWALSVGGLVLSAAAVSVVASVTTTLPGVLRTAALPIANVGVFAALWLVQFAILDRLVFGPDPGDAPGGGPVSGRRPLRPGRRVAPPVPRA